MWCHLYSFASFAMCVFYCPNVISFDNSSAHNVYNIKTDPNLNITNKLYLTNNTTNDTSGGDLSASSSQMLTWIRSNSGDYVNVKPIGDESQVKNEGVSQNIYNRNSSLAFKTILNIFNKNENRREDDLGLPPDIANEYIDAVNPPKFQIPVQYKAQDYITSSVVPVLYPNRLHAGSSVVTTKTNYSLPLKQNETPRNIDLADLIKAEFDAKKAELDQNKGNTLAPNLFALLPGGSKGDNPFLESNYKTPNRFQTSTNRPYVTSANSVDNYHTSVNNMGQFVYSEGMPSIKINIPSNNKPAITITTPTSISIISTSIPAIMKSVIVMKSSTTARPHNFSKMKIKTMSPTSTTTSKPTSKTTATYITSTSTTTKKTTRTTTTTTRATTTTTTTTKAPKISMSTTVTTNIQDKSNDWSIRVGNQSSDRSSESNDTNHLINRLRPTEIQSHEPFITDNILETNYNKNKKTLEIFTTESNTNKTDYNDFDYADNTALIPNYTVPDGFADFPNPNYRLTTERLAYILIGSCCALSILCLIVVAMSVRCRDMCNEYRSWKKAEKAALRWQRHQYRFAQHQQDLSRYFRTSVNPNQNSNVRTSRGPIYAPSCCHCISCSSSWMFRDINKGNREWCCNRGYYQTPRTKLPFGAASSVNTFMPRYANNSNNNNYCDEQEGDTDSLNTSDIIDNHHINPHNRHHFGEIQAPGGAQQTQPQRHPQLRRIAQPNGTDNWVHSSEIVDELHKKHSNINNISRDQTNHQNLNNFRSRNRQISNENIVVWNNNDERLI